MRLSYSAFNRITEQKAAELRAEGKPVPKPGRYVLSEARRLSEDQLLQRLRDLGMEMDRLRLDSLVKTHCSAEEIAKGFLDRWRPRRGQDELEGDWCWFALTVLWERWFRDVPNFERLDDGMQKGYELKDAPAQCDTWLGLWADLLKLREKALCRSLAEFDDRFGGTQSVFNWIQDFEMALGNVFIVLMLPGTAAAQPQADTKESYAPSPVIRSLTIEPGRQSIGDGDDWPITWADDGNLYTVYCDGKGFGGGSGQGSMSLAKIAGTPPNHTGENIASATGHRVGGGHEGRKASGLLMVDGALYMWVRNLETNGTGSSLAWSSDHAKTWTWEEWSFPEIGYPVWLNAGRNYEAAQDGYAYLYSPDTPSAYQTSDHMLLARVPRSRMSQKENYQFFAGLDEAGKARWSSRFGERKPVFSSLGSQDPFQRGHAS